jgi:hypothetical protein
MNADTVRKLFDEMNSIANGDDLLRVQNTILCEIAAQLAELKEQFAIECANAQPRLIAIASALQAEGQKE